MKATATEAGIELCLIDLGKPLADQGPFHAIIHKLRPSKGAHARSQHRRQLHLCCA